MYQNLGRRHQVNTKHRKNTGSIASFAKKILDRSPFSKLIAGVYLVYGALTEEL
jgi:heme oxygenase